MSYWQIDEDSLYSILGVEPGGLEYFDEESMPEGLPTDEGSRSTFLAALEDQLGNVESAVERVLDASRYVAKQLIDSFIVEHGMDPDDAKYSGYWYKNMADDFAQEELFGLQGGDPEYNEILSPYLPEMFEWLGIPEDPDFFDSVSSAVTDKANGVWEKWVVPTILEAWEAAKTAVLEPEDEDEDDERFYPLSEDEFRAYVQEFARDPEMTEDDIVREMTEILNQDSIVNFTYQQFDKNVPEGRRIIREYFAQDPSQQKLPLVGARVKRASLSRRASFKRTAVSTQTPEALARKIQALIDAAQAEWDEVMGRPDPTAYADVKIYTGEQAKRMGESNAPVVLTYDGAGYDVLSYQGEMEAMGGSELRDDLRNAAAEMGYMTEDVASWAMGFYPDETAKVSHRERTTPDWLRQELEDEFGPL